MRGIPMSEVEYMKLSEISRKASISVRTLKKHLNEFTHYRSTPRSPILVRWTDFQAWMDKRRQDAQEDPDVQEILERISQAVA
jgi:hypothetical protein